MDFSEELRSFSSKLPNLKSVIQTEEATKTALIMPFIQILGYNVFDPTEVCPECTADCGTKKGEKVDYAIMQNGKPVILIECKSVNADLSNTYFDQLYRYFSVTDAKIGILTNGIVYQFFTDIDAENRMDTKPFLEVDLLNMSDAQISALGKFRKEAFDTEAVIPSAIEMKYTREIKRILSEQLESPEEEFVKYFGRQITQSKLTHKIIGEMTPIVKRALNQFINDKINERLQSAMTPQENSVSEPTPEPEEVPEEKVVTTDEEIRGYFMVQAIVSDIVDPARVVMRDVQSYCGVLLDDNNRKPICRMYFNSPTRRYIGLFDGDKETKEAIVDLVDIYKYSDRLKAAVMKYGRKE